ncbi:MAG: hypothetical protein IPN94_06690 [Sphingobacteriales bacterium]|nr:hypothetical protein [Sphingobacteriales bacterium]
MSYILRHRKLGPIGSTHWFPLNNTYVRGDIDSIEDPGANTHTVLTAIPSPFARMHLFQTALEMVESNDSPAIDIKRTNHNGILSGGARKASKYHEMVSHCLDLWEIMFRFKNYQNGIKNQNNATLELIPYNLNDQLSGLERSYNDAHRLLGNTLRTFMTADRDSANFDLLTNSTLYLIVLNQVVIGCTSPLTFFFTPEDIAHNLQILHNITLKRSDTTSFFTSIVPLHKRDSDFQIYLHRFIAAYVKSNLSSRVKAFFDYTQKSLNYLQRADIHLFTEIQNIYNSNYNQNQFDKEYVAVECNGNTLQVLGNVIKQKVGSEFNSDFVMDATKLRTEPTGKIPLILVRGVDFPNWKYYNQTLFDTSQLKGTIPYADANSLATRTMPDIGITYPCLYVNDFLVPKLILLDEVNDGKHFFDGNTTTNQLEKFLLPIHENYFKYFTIQDLKSNLNIQRLNGMLDGKKQQYVKVTLIIPVINQRHVTLTKCYVDNPSADNRENVGTITSARINLAIFPFVKTSDGRFNDFYKIMLNSFSGERQSVN